MKNSLEKLFGIRGMTMVSECIDGTLIRKDAAVNFQEALVDRHGNHSISCMVLCMWTHFIFLMQSALDVPTIPES